MAVTREEMGYVQRFRQTGDAAAFRQLYLAYKDRAYALALITVRNPHDALDVVQDAFTEAYRTLSALRDPAAFAAWLCRIIIYRCNRIFRKRNDTLLSEEAGRFLTEIPDERPDIRPEAHADQLAMQHALFEAIAKLPPTQRACVVMHYFDDMTVSEIAAAMCCSQGTVKSRLNYARTALRKMLDVEDDDSRSLGAFAFLLIPLPVAASQRIARAIAAEMAAGMQTASVASGAAAGASAIAAGIGAAVGAVVLAAGLIAGSVRLSQERARPSDIAIAAPQERAVATETQDGPERVPRFTQRLALTSAPERETAAESDPIPLSVTPALQADEPLPLLGMCVNISPRLAPLTLGDNDVTDYMEALGETEAAALMRALERLGLSGDYRVSEEAIVEITALSMDDWYRGASSPVMLGGIRPGERLEHVFAQYDEDTAVLSGVGPYTVYAFAGRDGAELRLTVTAITRGGGETDEAFRTRLLSLIIKKIELMHR